MSNEELQKLVESNSKSIQALTDAITADREELKQFKRQWRQDRRPVFEWMSRLAAAEADFYEAQAEHYNILEKIEEKQAQMPSQILDILAQLARKDEQ
ncbi:MAG: hypothetical protein EA365_14490 [Gloeocapsa sp. DLM2.Bin57]|nr:MAG: hypothetical protein EA365_14490 [Gloeocapsa sp. DLM2.Bin57]